MKALILESDAPRDEAVVTTGLVTRLLDVQFSTPSNRMNEIMKRLTRKRWN